MKKVHNYFFVASECDWNQYHRLAAYLIQVLIKQLIALMCYLRILKKWNQVMKSTHFVGKKDYLVEFVARK